jgi:CO/xanthine dehydrogenase Mo-binding subunit
MNMLVKPPSWRVDGVEKVAGQALYTFDVSLSRMLHAKILRSPHAHARIISIDCTRARALPGVAAVVTGADLAGLDPFYGSIIQDQPILAIGKVRYAGDMIAAVAAEDDATAFAALALIEVEYEILPSVMTVEDSLLPGAPLLFETPQKTAARSRKSIARMTAEPAPNVLFEYAYENGDLAAAFARCDHVFEDRFVTNKINHFHLEPYVTIAHAKPNQLELWACNQDPFDLRKDIARMFRLPEGGVRINSAYVGGGFGGKSYCKMEGVAVLLALQVRRPVRLCLSMDEGLHTLCKPEITLTLKTGVMADGTLIARDSGIIVNSGAYADANAGVAIKAGYRIGGPYRWQALKTLARCVRTTTVPGGSFRGFGGTQATWASDSQIDMIARRLGLDPYAMRMQNLLPVGEAFLPGDRPIDSDLADGLEQVAERIGYHTRERVAGRGIGLSVAIKDGGGTGNHGQALVKMTPDGSVVINAGTTEIGQGAGTMACKVAAELLNAPLSSMRYGQIDTEHTVLDQGTRGSGGVVLVGKAVELAAIDLRTQILHFAAGQLGCAPDQLKLENHTILRGNEHFPLHKMILGFFGPSGYEFTGKGYLKTPFEEDTPLGSQAGCWIPSWVAAEVDVDRETGLVRVRRLVVAADTGRVINRLACRGQIEGGAIQAYGQAMFEHLKYTGDHLATGTPLTYRVPLAADLPKIFESIILEHGMGNGPFGAKGIGEASMLGVASAIANAIADAVGARITDLPMTPERVQDAIENPAP